MEKEYTKPPISIVAFKNTNLEKNPKGPLRNVKITFNADVELAEGTIIPSGTVLSGGMWGSTSKNGLQYLSGSLREQPEEYSRSNYQRKPQPKQQSREAIDF
jgi:hypothetical protein